MNQPIFHKRTSIALHNYLSQPTHGLILVGQEGSGKLYAANWLAQQLRTPSFIIEAEDSKSSITIEQIRELYGITRTGSSLVIIIKDAHQLGREAQNAFLKLLEEPPKNTRFILTTHASTKLLPTIRSRSQSVEVLPPTKSDLMDYVAQYPGFTESELKSLMHTSKGLPGTFIKLLEDITTLDDHKDLVHLAKRFYGASVYERNLMCIEQKFEKQWIVELLDLLAIIVQSLLKQNSSNQEMLQKLSAQANLIELTAQNTLHINGNPKIHLARLCQQL